MNNTAATADPLIESFTPLPLRLALARSAQSADILGVDRTTALLWLDIVDSTRIYDHFVDKGPAGTEQLASLLGQHFDRLLEIVVAHGGEPMMFAGDALLCGWPDSAGQPGAAVRRAAACGQAVLDAPGVELPSGAPLQLHAIVALGPCHNAEIGTGSDRLCVATGAGLADLRATARTRAAGRLLLSPSARGALADMAEVEPAGQGAVTLVRLQEVPAPEALAIPILTHEAVQRLRANVPLPIANRLDNRHLDWSAELRRVTAVFVAVPELEPDASDIIPRLESVLAAVGPIVRRHDGFLQQVQIADSGIKLLIVFGIPPVAHPDDPARAVRLAIDLRAELRGLGYRRSLGVATGPVFAGLIGNDMFRAWTQLGAPMNLASRLAGLPGGTIHCDEATMRGAQGSVDFAPLGRSQVRGVSPTVAIWTPRRHGLAETSVPMHGREIELAELLTAMHAATDVGPSRRTAPAGLEHLVLIVGESGMGKSRLVAEFQHQATTEGAKVLSGKADRIERMVPYLGWRGVLSQLLDLPSRAPEAAQRAAALAALGPALTPQAALLNAVLPLDLPESAETQMLAPMQRASARLVLLLDLLRRAATEHPLLVTIDDAHWLDDASWSLVEGVAKEVPGLCVVLSMQPPEDDGRLQALVRAGARQMRLGELSEEEQERLVLTRLRATRMTPELAALLRDRARGHPFFCLELAQALRDEGVIAIIDGTCRIASDVEAARLSLPSTVHGTVTRRIDRLDPDSQLTLKVASVSGLRFPTTLVVDVHPTAQETPGTVRHHLQSHQHVDLLLAERVEETEGYAFRHGILRDVAYSLLLFSHRRKLHRDIAAWYERVWQAEPSRVFAVLAHHLEAADEPDRAADYLRREAERVFGLGLARQSVEIGRHAARLLGADIPTDSAGLQGEIGRELERIAAALGGRPPAELAALPPIVDARAGQLIHLLLVIAPFAHQCGEMELFALVSCICLRLTLEHGNGPLAADVYAMYSVVFGALTGDRETAAAWSELSLALVGGQRGAAFARCGFINAWFHNHWMGSLEKGIALSEAGADAGFTDNEPIYGCFNLSASVVLLAAAGRPLTEVMSAVRDRKARNDGRVLNAAYHLVLELQYAKALAGLTRDVLVLGDAEHDEERDVNSIVETSLSNQIGYYYVTRLKLHVHGGDWVGALEWAARAQKMLPFFGGQPAEFELTQYRGLAALAAATFGAPEGKSALIDEGWDCTEQLRGWEARNPDLFCHKADLLDGLLQAASGNDAQAVKLLQRAADGAARTGLLPDVGLAQEYQARWWRAVGDEAGAKSAAATACETYRAWGAGAKVALLEDAFGLPARSPLLEVAPNSLG